MITARANTVATRIVYHEGGLYGPFFAYRWAITPSGSKLPIYAVPAVTEGPSYTIHEVLLTDVPSLPDEIQNLPVGNHEVWVQGSNDGVLYLPLFRDILQVVGTQVYEPL